MAKRVLLSGPGMAAITAVLSAFQTGDRILISAVMSMGTFRVLDKVFNHFGLNYTIADTTDLEIPRKRNYARCPCIFFVESPANPLLTITGGSRIRTCKKHGLLTIVDNTFMTPYLQRPIELGADIVSTARRNTSEDTVTWLPGRGK